MTGRRDFLKAAGSALVLSVPASTACRSARRLVRRGSLGRIGFCRVEHVTLIPALRFVLDGANCVVEVDPARRGAALLGSDATLVLDQAGYHLFGRNG